MILCRLPWWYLFSEKFHLYCNSLFLSWLLLAPLFADTGNYYHIMCPSSQVSVLFSITQERSVKRLFFFFSFSLFLFYWYFVTLRSGTDLKDLLFVQKAPPRFFPKRFDTCCNPYHEAMLVLSKLLTSSVKGKLFLFGLSTMLSVLLWFIPHWNIFLQQFCSSYSL